MVREGDHNRVLAAGLSILVLAYLSFAPALFNDGDTSWHLAAGRLMIGRGAVPDIDPFSYTALGRPWIAHEWLAEVLMAAAYAVGSWAALALIFALSVAATLFLAGREAGSRLSPLFTAATIIVLFILLVPFIVARPHVLAWPLLAGWTILLLRAREKERAPPLAAAALMLTWSNLHGSFLLGLALAGLFALEALLGSADRKKVLAQWGAFGLLSLLASVATPHGIRGLLFPITLSGMETLPLIQEWRPTDIRETPGLLIGLALGLAAVLRTKLWRQPLRLLLLAGLVYLAFAHVRHQAVLAIVGSLLLIFSAERTERTDAEVLKPVVMTALMIALAAIAVARLSLPLERRDSASNPLDAIASIPAELRRQPVLNSYSFGGPLILEGIRPFIDGRADMYGDDFLRLHKRLMDGDIAAFRAAADKWKLGWTILSPQDPLADRLRQEPGWRRIYADAWAVIDVREAPLSAPAR